MKMKVFELLTEMELENFKPKKNWKTKQKESKLKKLKKIWRET